MCVMRFVRALFRFPYATPKVNPKLVCVCPHYSPEADARGRRTQTGDRVFYCAAFIIGLMAEHVRMDGRDWQGLCMPEP